MPGILHLQSFGIVLNEGLRAPPRQRRFRGSGIVVTTLQSRETALSIALALLFAKDQSTAGPP